MPAGKKKFHTLTCSVYKRISTTPNECSVRHDACPRHRHLVLLRESRSAFQASFEALFANDEASDDENDDEDKDRNGAKDCDADVDDYDLHGFLTMVGSLKE